MSVDLNRLRRILPGKVRFTMIDRGQGRVGSYRWPCGCRAYTAANGETTAALCAAHESLARD